MKSAAQILDEKKMRLAQTSSDERNRSLLVGELNSGAKQNTSRVVTALERMQPPETNVNVNLSGIEKLAIESVSIEGIEELQAILAEFKGSTLEIVKELRRIKTIDIKIPKIELPTINVPRPEVTVNVPQAKPPVVNVAAPSVKQSQAVEKRVVEQTPQYDIKGNLVRFTEVYEDGSSCVMTTDERGKTKVEYRD